MKKPVKRSTPKRSEKGPLDLLLKALMSISELYPTDETAPGIVLSYIKRTKKFYASFARYEPRVKYEPGGKVVVASAYGDTMAEAVNGLVRNWLAGTKASRDLARQAHSLPAMEY